MHMTRKGWAKCKGGDRIWIAGEIIEILESHDFAARLGEDAGEGDKLAQRFGLVPTRKLNASTSGSDTVVICYAINMRNLALEQAFKLAQEQQGYVTYMNLSDVGIDPALARQWYQRGRVERVAQGVYRFPQVQPTELDAYRFATLWPAGRGVLSHETALQLHELCDVNPDKIHVTIPPLYRPKRNGGDLYVLHHARLDLHDITYIEGIPIVTPGRAITQALATKIPPHLIAQAIATARRLGRIRRQELDEFERQLLSSA